MPVGQDDVLRSTWQAQSTSPNTIIQNVFWWKVTDFVAGPDNDVNSDLNQSILALFTFIQLDFTTNYIATSIRNVNQTKKEFVGDTDPVFAGTAVVPDTNAAQVAIEILARGNQLGHTGRKYLGPIADASIDGGQVQAASAARMQLFANAWEQQFIGPVTGNTYVPGTATLGPGGVVTAFRQFTVGRAFVVQTARTQRRRTPGVGLG